MTEAFFRPPEDLVLSANYRDGYTPRQPAMRADSLEVTDSDLSFQHYKVLRQPDGSYSELGRGSMGITYKAFDVNLCCEVALKVINAATLEHPHARDRFVSEARAAAKLRHRNIASVYHLGNDGEHYFYAMEFVDGETLDALVRRQGPLPVASVLRILLQAARALAAATRQGLVHRDLKPANIMVTHEDDDDEMLVKLIDFGLAKPIASANGARPLTFGGFVGTPQFASPEQLEERPVDARSDIYSLGATAWFLLTGRAPFLGSLATICRQHLTQSPPWSQLPKPFPEIVRTLLGQMLEKDPARRPIDPVELRRQIESALEVIREPQPGLVPVRQKFAARAPQWPRPRGPRPAAPPPAEGEEPRTGMILKGRYELLRLVGEGNSGRVFQARDRGANEALVAIKVLHAELVSSTSERERLGEEVRLIQAAPHLHLTRIAGLESLLTRNTVFLAEEWLHGFTLLDFLAVRGGALALGETLRLLEQVAAAADHARSHDLDRLDFALHQFHLHFPGAGRGEVGIEEVRAPMQTAMAQWPAWLLKLNPLGTLRKGLESSTWAGDVTLIPGHPPTQGNKLQAASPNGTRGNYLRGVAQLTYELLGGAPGSPVYGPSGQAKYASLPALNEQANAVLQAALMDGKAFADGATFYAALTRASGCDSASLRAVGEAMPRPSREASIDSGLPASLGADLDDDELMDSAFGDAPTVIPRRGNTAERERPTGAGLPRSRGAAPAETDPWKEKDEPDEGGVWDRLALVSGEGLSSRLWIGGLLVCFVALLSGSIAFFLNLEHRGSRKTASPPNATRINAKNKQATGKLVSRLPSPQPTAAGSSVAIKPSGDVAPVPAVSPGPTRNGRLDTPPPEPLPTANARSAVNVEAEGTPPPLAPAPEDQTVRVHVTSKPVGAEIQSKGKVIGFTPLEISLPAGDHQLVARYKTWPEVHQSLHLVAGQSAANTEIHLIAPSLVPSAAASATPITRAQRAQQEAAVKRSFVRSTRGQPAANASASPSAATAGGDPAVRRALPKLHPFDPNGTFRPPKPSDDED